MTQPSKAMESLNRRSELFDRACDAAQQRDDEAFRKAMNEFWKVSERGAVG